MDSYAKGYLQRQTLTLAELESLPRLLRLRATTSLFFRLGRYTRGVDLQAGLIERMEEIAVGETWLKQNEEELLRRARNWYHEAQ
jgi:Ser/Thr protein kinase RdoA (MazF antagonist)